MNEVIKQDDGVVVMFATRAPGQVAAQPDPSGAVVVRGAASGNPKADPVTGRFAGGKAGGDPNKSDKTGNNQVVRQTGAGNIDPTAVQRRRDLVRRAASQMAEMTMTDASQWLEEFGVDASVARVDSFLADVHQQRLDYLVDAMVPNLRSTVDAHHRGQMVQLKVPKQWSSAVMGSLTSGEMLQLHQRLVGQGFDPTDVTNTLIKSQTNKKRKSELEQIFGETPGTQGQQPAKRGLFRR
jgi:hypothetical protein